MTAYMARARGIASVLGIAALGWTGPVAAQEARPLSLAAALALAEETSESVAMARAAVLRAEGEKLRARSQHFPQLYGSVGYTRTLASEFSAVRGGDPDTTAGPPEHCELDADPRLPVEERLREVERALQCTLQRDPLSALSGLFENLPFGRENQFNLGLSASATLFAGGRIRAQNEAAAAALETARVALATARAAMVLEIAQAYYDAALAQRLAGISEATLAQSRTTLEQTRLAREVGNQAEFDLLRAQVAYENQQPLVIQRRADRDLAMMRLKQLLDVELDAPIALTTDLVEAEPDAAVRLAADIVEVPADPVAISRAAVRQAEQAVRAQQALVDVAGAQRLPTLTLISNYGRVAYPTAGFPVWSDFRSNWTVGVSMAMPIFTGFRLGAEEKIAEAGLIEARARLARTRELATLDTRSAQERLEAARAAFQASAGTVTQARRAYEIAELRYTEGISTQIELTDARILLQQAEANRAFAGRDLQVATLRLALLPNLPLGAVQGVGDAQEARPAAPQASGATTRTANGNGF